MPVEQRSPRKRRLPAVSEDACPGPLWAQGLRTRNTIVRVARKLLLEGRPMGFSARAVADRARISARHLQYGFPTRAAVLRAIMGPEIRG